MELSSDSGQLHDDSRTKLEIDARSVFVKESTKVYEAVTTMLEERFTTPASLQRLCANTEQRKVSLVNPMVNPQWFVSSTDEMACPISGHVRPCSIHGLELMSLSEAAVMSVSTFDGGSMCLIMPLCLLHICRHQHSLSERVSIILSTMFRDDAYK